MPTEKSMSAEGQHEPLFHAPAADAAGGGGDGGSSWPTALGFVFLTFNSGMAIYRSGGDAATVAFVASSYLDLVLLFCCLRWYEKAEPGSSTRGRLKMAVWLLITALTIAFSYKMAAVMPFVVWAMACATLLGGFFFALLLHYFRKGKTGLVAVLGGVATASIRLIADTGATIHIVGDRRLLSGFQAYPVTEWVALPNGNSLRILGIGRIEFEHFRIPNVYLVEGFHKCLISMSQLDRDHGMYSLFGRGIGRIMLTDGTQVGGAILDESDGMYVLSNLEVPLPAQ